MTRPKLLIAAAKTCRHAPTGDRSCCWMKAYEMEIESLKKKVTDAEKRAHEAESDQDTLKFDIETVRVQRDNAQHLLSKVENGAKDIIRELLSAFTAYEMNVDTSPTHKHRAMVDRALAFVKGPKSKTTPSRTEEAKAVECPDCEAPEGEACVADDGTEIKNGAHAKRISKARREMSPKKGTETCGNCGNSGPTSWCPDCKKSLCGECEVMDPHQDDSYMEQG